MSNIILARSFQCPACTGIFTMSNENVTPAITPICPVALPNHTVSPHYVIYDPPLPPNTVTTPISYYRLNPVIVQQFYQMQDVFPLNLNYSNASR